MVEGNGTEEVLRPALVPHHHRRRVAREIDFNPALVECGIEVSSFGRVRLERQLALLIRLMEEHIPLLDREAL